MSASRPTRVALVDDHAIVEVAFRAALAEVPSVQFLGISPTVHELLVEHPDAELVVLDLRLADGSSPISNVTALREHGMRVIAYTSGEDPYFVRLVARTEVLGIVRKSAPVDVLLETIRSAAAGQALMSTEWAAAIDADPELADAGLSAQEEAVLAMFATGLKTQAVASALGIAVGTVEDYVRRIRSKYARVGRAAPTKIDLYKRAIEDGFLPMPGRE
ncbi:LuxR C-terminal-related transcriptional regulator [Lysinimonas soli]|uniref:LuxR C-terminal-related transcriptional regulator n=1 Tax=Lysinimonas soli TaxID=1074233 RepID=A0ABW0NKZ6_9MICO